MRIFIRLNSSIPKIERSVPGRVRDFFRTPTAKSVFLTFVFGTVVVETMKNRKELEQLNDTYRAKFSILEDTIDKLRQGKPVDVAAELKIANALTKNKYNAVNEVDLDEQWAEFIKMVSDDRHESKDEVKHDTMSEKISSEKQEIQEQNGLHKVNTNKFL